MLAGRRGEASTAPRQELRRLVEGWLTPDWSRTDRAERLASHAELFLAPSASDGTFLAWVRTTASRLYLVARPARP